MVTMVTCVKANAHCIVKTIAVIKMLIHALKFVKLDTVVNRALTNVLLAALTVLVINKVVSAVMAV